MRAPDPAFADPRLAVLYDVFEADRRDLDAYVAIAEEVAATRIVDMGCGTGSLAVRFAALDLSVIGIDPAAASLEVAVGSRTPNVSPGCTATRPFSRNSTAKQISQ